MNQLALIGQRSLTAPKSFAQHRQGAIVAWTINRFAPVDEVWSRFSSQRHLVAQQPYSTGTLTIESPGHLPDCLDMVAMVLPWGGGWLAVIGEITHVTLTLDPGCPARLDVAWTGESRQLPADWRGSAEDALLEGEPALLGQAKLLEHHHEREHRKPNESPDAEWRR
jgi:hypothetical protein